MLDKTINGTMQRSERGVALIEGLIAILIFSIGILGLVGLQARTTQTTSLAKSRVDASFIASQRIADIWGDLPAIASKSEADTPVSGLPSGKRTTRINGNNVTVTVEWKMPNTDGWQRYTTVAVVAGN